MGFEEGNWWEEPCFSEVGFWFTGAEGTGIGAAGDGEGWV